MYVHAHVADLRMHVRSFVADLRIYVRTFVADLRIYVQQALRTAFPPGLFLQAGCVCVRSLLAYFRQF